LKENIHPKYFKTTASCACGATFDMGSTKEGIRVDICSKCHPLFTGTMKLLDTEGRVEKFKKKYEKAAEREKTQKDLTEKRKREKEVKAKKQGKATVMEKLAEMRKGTERKPEGKKAPAPIKAHAKPGPSHSRPEKKTAKKSK